MPRVYGILETALSAKDLPRAAEFYRELFDFETLLESERLIALDVAGQNVLLLFQAGATSEPFATPGGVIPGHAGSGAGHLAFAIGSDEVGPWRERLEAQGIAIESVVNWDGGAQSLYFRDPDKHLVELMTPGFWRLRGGADPPRPAERLG
jgi:catechol 2,3-dioxygenase-like lactoylglutathione lyase family enzyme